MPDGLPMRGSLPNDRLRLLPVRSDWHSQCSGLSRRGNAGCGGVAATRVCNSHGFERKHKSLSRGRAPAPVADISLLRANEQHAQFRPRGGVGISFLPSICSRSNSKSGNAFALSVSPTRTVTREPLCRITVTRPTVPLLRRSRMSASTSPSSSASNAAFATEGLRVVTPTISETRSRFRDVPAVLVADGQETKATRYLQLGPVRLVTRIPEGHHVPHLKTRRARGFERLHERLDRLEVMQRRLRCVLVWPPAQRRHCEADLCKPDGYGML